MTDAAAYTNEVTEIPPKIHEVVFNADECPSWSASYLSSDEVANTKGRWLDSGRCSVSCCLASKRNSVYHAAHADQSR